MCIYTNSRGRDLRDERRKRQRRLYAVKILNIVYSMFFGSPVMQGTERVLLIAFRRSALSELGDRMDAAEVFTATGCKVHAEEESSSDFERKYL